MKFYIADAFTNTLFGGNPAGIVILNDASSFPSGEIMQKCAAELRYSETAFIKRLSDDTFQIRYFTPAGEVDLCGHATIASFYCLMEAGIISDNRDYKYKTLAGDLNASIRDKSILMDMASPVHIGTIKQDDELNELYSIMGAEYEDMNLYPMIISTGLPDIMMPVKDKQVLDSLSPDFKKLTDFSKKYQVVGVHAFAIGDKDVMAYCRNFAPLYDIDEEAATGTSNGALTYYYHLNNLPLEESGTNIIIQGEAMNRPSVIKTMLTVENDNVTIRVGGSAVILARGEIDV